MSIVDGSHVLIKLLMSCLNFPCRNWVLHVSLEIHMSESSFTCLNWVFLVSLEFHMSRLSFTCLIKFHTYELNLYIWIEFAWFNLIYFNLIDLNHLWIELNLIGLIWTELGWTYSCRCGNLPSMRAAGLRVGFFWKKVGEGNSLKDLWKVAKSPD